MDEEKQKIVKMLTDFGIKDYEEKNRLINYFMMQQSINLLRQHQELIIRNSKYLNKAYPKHIFKQILNIEQNLRANVFKEFRKIKD